MADEQNQTPNVEPQGAPHGDSQTEPHGDSTDYKALYEQLKADARKWEDRAKANLDKAKAYDELQAQAQQQAQANKSLEEQVADIRSQLNASNVANMRLKISSEKNVPERFVFGATEDEMRESAEAFLEEVSKIKQAPTAPIIPNDGNSPHNNTEALTDYEQAVHKFLGGN